MRSWRAVFHHLLQMRLTALAVLLILTVGITANLVVFMLVNAALLRPLPFPEPHRLLALDDRLNGKSLGISWGEIREWRRTPGLFASAAAFRKRTWGLTDHTGAGLQVVLSGMVSPGFFQVLGTKPLIGSAFDPREDAGADEQVALLSYDLWQKRYGGNAGVINQSLALNDVSYKIVGVLPRGFDLPITGQMPDIFIPLSSKDYCCQGRGLEGIARLAPGISLAVANQRLEALSEATARSEGLQRFSSRALPLQEFLAQGQRRTFILLWLSVLALGLVGALNAGALLLARSLRQLRQYALKLSLGAGLGDLLREQIALAILFTVLAGGSALGIGVFATAALRRSPLFQPFLASVVKGGTWWDWRVFCFCGALSFIAALGACTLPLVLLRGLDLEPFLRSHAGLSSPRRGLTVRTALIVAQLAVSVMLFAAATSFGHSLYAVLNRNPGFRTSEIVMAGIGVPEARYDTDEKMLAFHEQALAAIRTIPGVGEVGFGAGAPINPFTTRFLMDGLSVPAPQRPRVALAVISPGMFHLLAIPLLRGRDFQATDRLNTPLVAIVNQAFARLYLNPADPLGRGMQVQFYNGPSGKPWPRHSIVGLVADSRSRTLDRDPEPEIYLSANQVPLEGGYYFLDTTRPAATLATELPAAIWQVDSQVERVRPVAASDFVGRSFSDKRAATYLSLSFAVLALSLAAAGLGSSISAAVSEATKEIGIRSALGESRPLLAARVLCTALARTLLGTACGLAGAFGLSRIATVSIDPQLRFEYGILPAVIAVMLLVSVLASIFPMQRALRISALEAVKAE